MVSAIPINLEALILSTLTYPDRSVLTLRKVVAITGL